VAATARWNPAGRRRALLQSAVAAAVAVLALSPGAGAHGEGGSLGFRSTVTGVTPQAAGVSATVLDFDDRLRVVNDSGRQLVVLGYEGEPYLAFRDGAVHLNMNSPATYLNDDRFGQVALPSRADPKAEPDWEQVASREAFEWHDHRIHWMSQTLPPKVRAAVDERHHIFDWSVPTRLDGRALTISGSLDYEPPPRGRPTILIGALVVIALGGAGAIWLRKRRIRRKETTYP
jgi:hypothetical protein